MLPIYDRNNPTDDVTYLKQNYYLRTIKTNEKVQQLSTEIQIPEIELLKYYFLMHKEFKGFFYYNKLQTLWRTFIEDVYNKQPALTDSEKTAFLSNFQSEMSDFFNFDSESNYTKRIKQNEDMIPILIDFFERFVYYFKSNSIYVLFGKIKNLQDKLKLGVFNNFDNYMAYSNTVDFTRLVFKTPCINDKNKVTTVIDIDAFLSTPIESDDILYTNETYTILNTYFNNLQDIKGKYDTIFALGKTITIMLLNTKNEKYKKDILFYFPGNILLYSPTMAKAFFIELTPDPTDPEQKEMLITKTEKFYKHLMVNIFKHVIKVAIDKTNENPDFLIASDSISRYITRAEKSYTNVDALLTIDKEIEELNTKLTYIRWEDIETNEIDGKPAPIVKMIAYLKHLTLNNDTEKGCFYYILNNNFNDLLSIDINILKKIKEYLKEVKEIIHFFEYKTKGYNQAVKQHNDDLLNDIRNITFKLNDATYIPEILNCKELFVTNAVTPMLKQVKVISANIDTMKNGLIVLKQKGNLKKLKNEMAELFATNNIDVSNFNRQRKLIDEIFDKDHIDPNTNNTYTWYIDSWWENINEDELKTILALSKGQGLLKINFKYDYDEHILNSNEDPNKKQENIIKENIKKIYCYEIKNLLFQTYKIGKPIKNPETGETIDYFISENKSDLQTKIENTFDQMFTNSLKFTPFYNTKRINWLSFLWWFFNIYIEEEKTKAIPETPVKENENNDALIECQTRERKCQSDLTSLRKEFSEIDSKHALLVNELKQQIKRLTDEQLQIQEKIKEIDNQTTKIENRFNQPPSEEHIQQLEHERATYLSQIESLKKREDVLNEKLRKCTQHNAEFAAKLRKIITELEEIKKKEIGFIQNVAVLSSENNDATVKIVSASSPSEVEKYKKIIENNKRELKKYQSELHKVQTTYAHLYAEFTRIQGERAAHAETEFDTSDLENQISELKQSLQECRNKRQNSIDRSSIGKFPRVTPSPIKLLPGMFEGIAPSLQIPISLRKIEELLIVCITESYILNKPIHKQLPGYPTNTIELLKLKTPMELIQHLNDSHEGILLNRILHFALTNNHIDHTHKHLYINALYSQPNINPSIQYANGFTILDILVSNQDYIVHVNYVLKHNLFDINNNYPTLTIPHTRPIIVAITNMNIGAIIEILKYPDCNAVLQDSKGLTSLDHLLKIKNSDNTYEYKIQVFKMLVLFNKHNKFSIFNSDIIPKLPYELQDILLRYDTPLFKKLYTEQYNMDSQKMDKLKKRLLSYKGGRHRNKRKTARGRCKTYKQTKARKKTKRI